MMYLDERPKVIQRLALTQSNEVDRQRRHCRRLEASTIGGYALNAIPG